MLAWTKTRNTTVGTLGTTEMFTVGYATTRDPGGMYVLDCKLPGRAALRLAQQRFQTEQAARNKAVEFLGWWLARYTAEFAKPADDTPTA